MSHDEFVALVAEMRAAQKEYFAHRSKVWLEKSKELERAVDRAVVAELNPQASLFSAEAQP